MAQKANFVMNGSQFKAARKAYETGLKGKKLDTARAYTAAALYQAAFYGNFDATNRLQNKEAGLPAYAREWANHCATQVREWHNERGGPCSDKADVETAEAAVESMLLQWDELVEARKAEQKAKADERKAEAEKADQEQEAEKAAHAIESGAAFLTHGATEMKLTEAEYKAALAAVEALRAEGGPEAVAEAA